MQIIFLGDQVHETRGCCHLLIQQQLRCLCLGTRAIDKVASVNIILQRACPISETKISPASVILVSQLGKPWVDVDLYLLAYAIFPV